MKGLRHRELTGVAALAVLAGLLGASAATGQGHCTMDKLAGTYAYEFRGASTFVVEPAPPPYRHWSMVSAPFLAVGWITIGPDGAVVGESWVTLGTLASGLSPRPFESGRLTELDESTCTAVFEWMGSPIAEMPPGLHHDRFVWVNGRREFRSMLMDSPSGTMAWTGRGYRINDAIVGTCDPRLLRGDLLLQCEALESWKRMPAPAFAASMSVLTVARDGSYVGISHVKDPEFAEWPVHGVLEVQPNCTVEATLELPEPEAAGWAPNIVQYGRGVIFERGRRGFLMMPVETKRPVRGEREPEIVSPGYALCELRSIGR